MSSQDSKKKTSEKFEDDQVQTSQSQWPSVVLILAGVCAFCFIVYLFQSRIDKYFSSLSNEFITGTVCGYGAGLATITICEKVFCKWFKNR